MKKIFLLFIIAVATTSFLAAQTVSNATFRQDGQMVVISYDLSEKADISIEVSTDGGATYGTPRMVHVSGDVGKDVAPGRNKQARWNVLLDCASLQGDRICFRVNAVKPSANQTFTVGGVSFTMVFVEGGTFTMGCTGEQGSDCESREEPSHRVSLSNFYIGETEVTQALWRAVMGSNPSYYKGDNLPVENVSYDDCKKFIKKLNNITGRTFRLPTEAEWEYAARGCAKSRGYKYSGSNTIDDVAWYHLNSGSTTHPVKQKRANELGLYDMSGNVSEWCFDGYDTYSSTSQTNPTVPGSGSYRVKRGGGWNYGAGGCRVSSRNYYTPKNHNGGLGFRLALVP